MRRGVESTTSAILGFGDHARRARPPAARSRPTCPAASEMVAGGPALAAQSDVDRLCASRRRRRGRPRRGRWPHGRGSPTSSAPETSARPVMCARAVRRGAEPKPRDFQVQGSLGHRHQRWERRCGRRAPPCRRRPRLWPIDPTSAPPARISVGAQREGQRAGGLGQDEDIPPAGGWPRPWRLRRWRRSVFWAAMFWSTARTLTFLITVVVWKPWLGIAGARRGVESGASSAHRRGRREE